MKKILIGIIFSIFLICNLFLLTTAVTIADAENVTIDELLKIHADCEYSCEHTPSLFEQLNRNSNNKEVPTISNEIGVCDIDEELRRMLQSKDVELTDEQIETMIQNKIEFPDEESIQEYIQNKGKNILSSLSSCPPHSPKWTSIGTVPQGCVLLYYEIHDCERCGLTVSVIYAGQSGSHSWGTPGWCGKTCTKCGYVQRDHPVGGCYYCR